MDTTYYINTNCVIKEPEGELAKIKLVVVDVDGTLTDSGIYYEAFLQQKSWESRQ